MPKNREVTITRILGQAFVVGPIEVTLVALARNKARLVISLPDDVDVEDFGDFEDIVKSTIVMQDDSGWRRAIHKSSLESAPSRPIKEGASKQATEKASSIKQQEG